MAKKTNIKCDEIKYLDTYSNMCVAFDSHFSLAIAIEMFNEEYFNAPIDWNSKDDQPYNHIWNKYKQYNENTTFLIEMTNGTVSRDIRKWYFKQNDFFDDFKEGNMGKMKYFVRNSRDIFENCHKFFNFLNCNMSQMVAEKMWGKKTNIEVLPFKTKPYLMWLKLSTSMKIDLLDFYLQNPFH